MNKILLVTRPKYDDTTYYLFHWTKKVIKLADKKGIQILDLKEKRANRKEFESIMLKKQPLLIFLNGHGNVDRVTGQNGEILIKTNDNEVLLKSKIVYALSCKSGKELGHKSIEKGAVAYIGYDDDFIFYFEDNKVSKPLDDKTAKLFIEPSNYVIESLLKGHSVGVSCQRSRQLYKKNIQKLLSIDSSSELIPFLIWDMKHQVCLGDKEGALSKNK